MTIETKLIPEPVPATPDRFTKQDRQRGGRINFRRHGRAHMIAIARLGGIAASPTTSVIARALGRARPRSYYVAIGILAAKAFNLKYSHEVRVAIGHHSAHCRAARPRLDRYFRRLDTGTEVAVTGTEVAADGMEVNDASR